MGNIILNTQTLSQMLCVTSKEKHKLQITN